MSKQRSNTDQQTAEQGVSRRQALGTIGAGVASLSAASIGVVATRQSAAAEDEEVLTEAKVLRDPDIPVAGNPNGDIAIVEWFDYACPYCRKLEPDLQKVARKDGKIRLIFKDWPILGPVSIYAAKLVQATRYQEKFIQAHDALMANKGRLTEAGARDILAAAAIDVARAAKDMTAHAAEIDAILKRNDDQARAFGFSGTPSFIVGKFRVPGILTPAQFELAIADARKAASGKK